MIEEAVSKAVAQAMEESPGKDEGGKDAPKGSPTFKGDITNPDDVAMFQYETRKWEITSKADMANAESVAQLSRDILALREEYSDVLTKSSKAGNKPEPSRQPIGKSDGKADSQANGSRFYGIDGDHTELAGLGSLMAKAANEARGHIPSATAPI